MAPSVLHYAQMLFEGMKAYKRPDGGIQIFRPDMNAKRMANTCERMCMPKMDYDLFLAAVKAVVHADEDWVPSEPGTALYIRPFMIADEVSSFPRWAPIMLPTMAACPPPGSSWRMNSSGRPWAEPASPR